MLLYNTTKYENKLYPLAVVSHKSICMMGRLCSNPLEKEPSNLLIKIYLLH